MPAARLIGVGVFVVGGLVIFALGLFMIGDRRFLFDDLFMVNAEFAQVAGLRDGAAVRVNGLEAGEVLDIAIPPSPAGRFRVRMRLREELRPLVRADSVASIRTDGIVGGRYVQIEAGSESSPAVDDGGVLKAREPFDFADLLDQGTKTIDSVNVTINELRSHLNEVVGLVKVTATNANELVNSVSDDLTSISRSGRRLSEETIRIVEGIQAGRGTIGKLVNDEELYTRVAGIAAEAEQAAKTARIAADGARSAIARLQESGSSDGAVQSIVGELRQTLSSTRDAMANLAENTEALKRNVLVRGFFEDRGYYDLDGITAIDYRQGVLAGKHRDPHGFGCAATCCLRPHKARRKQTRRCRRRVACASIAPWPKSCAIPKTHRSWLRAMLSGELETCCLEGRPIARDRCVNTSSRAMAGPYVSGYHAARCTGDQRSEWRRMGWD